MLIIMITGFILRTAKGIRRWKISRATEGISYSACVNVRKEMENTMKEIQFLKGERVYLRPFTDEDTDFFDVWYNDARTRAKIAAPYPTTAAQS